MNSNLKICKSVAANIYKLKTEKLADQKAFIDPLQNSVVDGSSNHSTTPEGHFDAGLQMGFMLCSLEVQA